MTQDVFRGALHSFLVVDVITSAFYENVMEHCSRAQLKFEDGVCVKRIMKIGMH